MSLKYLKSWLSKVVLIFQYVPTLLVTLGSERCLLAFRKQDPSAGIVLPPTCGSFVLGLSDAAYGTVFGHFASLHYLVGSDLVIVNGVGDSLVGAVAAEWWKTLKEPEETSCTGLCASITWSAWEHILEKGQWASLAIWQHEAAASPAIQDLATCKDLLRKKRRDEDD